jgi:thioester reductase-like protein
MGDSLSGAANPGDFMYAFLKGCIQLGAYPNLNWNIDPVPVDFAAQMIVSSMAHWRRFRPGNSTSDLSVTANPGSLFTFHVLAPNHTKLDSLFKMIASAHAPYETIARLGFAEWRTRLMQQLEEREASNQQQQVDENALKLFAPVFSLDLESQEDSHISCELTGEFWKEINLVYPNIDQQLIERYTRWLIEQKIWPAHPGRTAAVL